MNKLEQYSFIGLLVMVIVICLINKRYNELVIVTSSFALSYLVTKSWYYSLLMAILVYCIFYQSKSSYITEGMTNKKKSKKSKKNKKKKIKNNDGEEENSDEDEDEDNEEKSHIDIGSTFMKAYQSLTPDAIEGMSKDTRSLIDTQKKLVSTIEHLGPTLKEGKKVLDTFKNYFDDSNLMKLD